MNKVVMVAIAALLLAGVAALSLKPDNPQPATERSGSSNSSSAVASVSDPLPVNSPTPANRSSATGIIGSGSVKLPATPVASTRSAEVDLWRLNKSAPNTRIDGHPAKQLQTDPVLIEQFHVGQKLNMYIPQRDVSVEARLESTRNQSANVHIFQGKILSGSDQGSLLVARGKIETHVTISTKEGTYSAIIDNETGDTVLLDEGDITVNQVPIEDGIPVPPIEQGPPPGG